MWLIVSLYTERRNLLYNHYSYLNGSCHHQHPFLPSTRLHSNHSPVQKLWHQKWIPCSAIGVFRIYCWTNRANKVLIPHFWSKDPESPISGLHRHSLDYLLLSSQHVFTNFFNTNLKVGFFQKVRFVFQISEFPKKNFQKTQAQDAVGLNTTLQHYNIAMLYRNSIVVMLYDFFFHTTLEFLNV